MDYYEIASALLNHTSAARKRWHHLAKLVYPRLIPASRSAENRENADDERICYVARGAALTLASAHSDYITPMGHRWFQFCSWLPEDKTPDDAKDWYAQATSIAQRELEASNFYSELNSVYIDRVITGTGLLMVNGDTEKCLIFEHVPAGTYALGQNAAHEVNKVVRVFTMTAADVEETWGVDALTPTMKQAWGDASRHDTEEFEIWHLVCPRAGGLSVMRGLGPEVRPFVSVYIDPESKMVLNEDGYYEFPFMCTRFLRSGSQVYGDSALSGMGDLIRKREKMAEILEIVGQKIAFPPIVTLGTQADEVDMRGGGVTVISPEEAGTGYPRQLAPSGEYRVGLDLLERMDADIKTGLFNDMLLAVSSVPRPMTATEVQSRESEKVMSFSASFGQCVSDYRPLMTRLFCLLARAEKLDLDKAPPGLIREVEIAKGMKEKALILSPKVAYVGKMSQALAQAQTSTFVSILQQLLGIINATGNQEWGDKLDGDKAIGELLRNANIPYEITRSTDEVNAIRAKRAQAVQQAQEAEMQAKLGAANASNAQALERLNTRKPL